MISASVLPEPTTTASVFNFTGYSIIKSLASRGFQIDDKPRKAGFCKGTPASGPCGASELRLPLAAERCQSAFVNALKKASPREAFYIKNSHADTQHTFSRGAPVLSCSGHGLRNKIFARS
jgi:hypothetical protein